MNKPDKAFGLASAEDSTGFLLWQVATLWQRGIKKSLENIAVTHPQFVLLASLLWLSKQQPSVTQIDLSRHTKIDPMTTSTIIRTLQRKHLIEREEHPTDTRAKAITLTDKGIKTTRQAVKIIENFDAGFFLPLADKAQGFNTGLLALLRAPL